MLIFSVGVSTAGVFTAFVGQCVDLCCFGPQTTTISCFRGVEEICEITGSTLDRKSSYTGEVVLKSNCLQICNLTEEYSVFYECSQLIEKKKPLCNLSLTVSSKRTSLLISLCGVRNSTCPLRTCSNRTVCIFHSVLLYIPGGLS